MRSGARLIQWMVCTMIILASVALSTHAYAGLNGQPEVLQEIQPGEVISFKTSWLDSGALFYQGKYEYSTIVVQNEHLLRQVGRFTFANGNIGEEESLLVPAQDRFRPRSFYLKVTSPTGKVLRVERMIFNATATSARVIRTYSDSTRQEDNGITDEVDKTIALPPDTFPRQMFDAMLRVMELKPGDRRRLNVVTRMGEIYGIILQAEDYEKIQSPAGLFDTIRVRLIPDIPLLPKLMPSLAMRLWYSSTSPRLPVKFEGYPQPPPPRLQKEVRSILVGVEHKK